jgi:hypothetical protein
MNPCVMGRIIRTFCGAVAGLLTDTTGGAVMGGVLVWLRLQIRRD